MRDGATDPFRVRARNHVATFLDRLDPLSLVAERDAGTAEEEGFLLESARIGQHDPCIGDERNHVQVAQRFHGAQSTACRQHEARIADDVGRARMQGEDHRTRSCADRRKCFEQLAEARGLCVVRAMQCRYEVGALCKPDAFEHARAFERDRREGADRVQHDVADEAGACREALVRQVAHRFGRGRKQEVGKMVGCEAVRLLGHPPVEAPEAGLDVCDRQVELDGRQRRGERRVGVAVGQHHVRPKLEHRRFERFQHAGRLPAVASRADAEVEVRLRNSKLGKEDVRHRRVVVLAGMHDQARDRRAACVCRLDCAAEWGKLHKLRSRADDLHQHDRLA